AVALCRAIQLHDTAHHVCAMHAVLLLTAAMLLAPRAYGQASSAQPQAPRSLGRDRNGMRIYIWAGLKSHGAGQHDYPQFLADWSKILTEHGAVVDGALHEPSSADLEQSDVVIIYKGDAGTSLMKRNRCWKVMSSGAGDW